MATSSSALTAHSISANESKSMKPCTAQLYLFALAWKTILISSQIKAFAAGRASGFAEESQWFGDKRERCYMPFALHTGSLCRNHHGCVYVLSWFKCKSSAMPHSMCLAQCYITGKGHQSVVKTVHVTQTNAVCTP